MDSSWEYRTLKFQYIRDAHAFILLYDVTSRYSFDLVLSFYMDILGKRHEPQPRVSCNSPGIVARSIELSQLSAGHTKGLMSLSQKLRVRLRIPKHPSDQSAEAFTCFPRLPTELQLSILRMCLTSPDPIIDRKPHHNNINMDILLVCKMFYNKGIKFYREANTFRPSMPVWIVADITNPSSRKQQVTSEDGKALADRLGCTFVESSSMIYDTVEPIFEGLVRECRIVKEIQKQHEVESSQPISAEVLEARKLLQRNRAWDFLARISMKATHRLS